MQTKRKAGLLIVFLLITVAMAVAFFPSVNGNVAEGLGSITAIDTDSLDGATRTIFDSISYARSIHILAMLLLGFGFLMVFLRGHEFTTLTATFLAASISIPVYLLVKSFLPGEFEVMNISGFLYAEFAAASLLICMGAVLGRLKMEQYFVLAILFTLAYIFNEWLLLESGLFEGFLDTGGSVAIHAFGAYFGLGVVATTAKKFQDKPGPKADKISNEFCLLGSMILWLFWPSFTSAVVAPELGYLTVLNTVLALCGSTLATYVFSKLIRGKIEVEDIANAALAGGVCIGSTCSTANPGFAMVIGICAGTLSTLGLCHHRSQGVQAHPGHRHLRRAQPPRYARPAGRPVRHRHHRQRGRPGGRCGGHRGGGPGSGPGLRRHPGPLRHQGGSLTATKGTSSWRRSKGCLRQPHRQGKDRRVSGGPFMVCPALGGGLRTRRVGPGACLDGTLPVGTSEATSRRSAPGAPPARRGSPFLPRNGEKEGRGCAPGPRGFHSRSFPLAGFWDCCLWDGRGAITTGILKPIWDAFSSEKYAEKAFCERKFPNQGYTDGCRNSPSTGTMRHNRQNERARASGPQNRGSRGHCPRRSFPPAFSGESRAPRPESGGNPRGRSGPAPVLTGPPCQLRQGDAHSPAGPSSRGCICSPPQGGSHRGGDQPHLCHQGGRFAHRVILAEGDEVVVLPAQQFPDVPGRAPQAVVGGHRHHHRPAIAQMGLGRHGHRGVGDAGGQFWPGCSRCRGR